MKKVAFLLAGAMFLTGCASMFSGNADEINVNSTEPGTLLYVDGRLIGRDRGIAEVSRGSIHEIRAEKEGCEPVVRDTGRSLDGRTFVGCLIDFCILSVPLDFAIGGALRASPTSYTVNPVCT